MLQSNRFSKDNNNILQSNAVQSQKSNIKCLEGQLHSNAIGVCLYHRSFCYVYLRSCGTNFRQNNMYKITHAKVRTVLNNAMIDPIERL